MLPKLNGLKLSLVVVSFLLVLSQIAMQAISSDADKLDKEMLASQGKINSLLLSKLEASQTINQFTLYEIFKPDVLLPEDAAIASAASIDERYSRIYSQFKSREITTDEYFRQMKGLYQDYYEKLSSQQDAEWASIGQKNAAASQLAFWKDALSVANTALILLILLLSVIELGDRKP